MPRDDAWLRRRHRAKPSSTSYHSIRCRSDEAYTCQSSLSIILNARSRCTFRLVRQYDSQRIIEVDYPKASRLIPFEQFLANIGTQRALPIQLDYLDVLEGSLLSALRLLHANNISFPISTQQIALLRTLPMTPDDITCVTLFLPYNKKAFWASDELSPTWQADQLSHARLIFHIAKLLVRLSILSSRPVPLDPLSQQVLATHLTEYPAVHHTTLCSDNIAPMTAELTYHVALAFAKNHKTQESRDVLEFFFGGPMPLHKPGTSPDTIYMSYVQLRACVSLSAGSLDCSGSDKTLEDEFKAISTATLTRMVCCRAETATHFRDLDEPQWWRMAMSLYDAFLFDEPPIEVLERICAFDLYRFRES